MSSLERPTIDPSDISKAELGASDGRRIVARVVQERLSHTRKAVLVELAEDLTCIVRCGNLGGTTWIAMQHSECDGHKKIEIEVSYGALDPLSDEESTSESHVKLADNVWDQVRIHDRCGGGVVEAQIGYGPCTASTRQTSSGDRDLKVAIHGTYRFVIVQCRDPHSKLGIGVQREILTLSKYPISEYYEIYVPQGVLNYRPDDVIA